MSHRIGICPTDFTDLHRSFCGSFLSHRFHRFTQIFLRDFFCHADFADDADFLFFWDFFSSDFTEESEAFLLRRLLTDFRGCDLFGRCRYPLRVEYVPQISQIYTDYLRFNFLPFLHFSFLICHFSFVISHFSFLICHFSFVISHLSLKMPLPKNREK